MMYTWYLYAGMENIMYLRNECKMDIYVVRMYCISVW